MNNIMCISNLVYHWTRSYSSINVSYGSSILLSVIQVKKPTFRPIAFYTQTSCPAHLIPWEMCVILREIRKFFWSLLPCCFWKTLFSIWNVFPYDSAIVSGSIIQNITVEFISPFFIILFYFSISSIIVLVNPQICSLFC